MIKKAVTGLTALALGLSLAGCAPGANSGGGTDPDRQIIIDPELIEPTTITVLDYFPDAASPLSRWMDAAQAAFTEQYPNITIERESQTFDDITKTLPLRLSDPSIPDVVPVNQGWQGLGTLGGEEGLLLNLDEYAAAYGWEDSLPETILAQHRVEPDNSAIGTGSIYGLPVNQGGFLTINVNLDMLDRLGLEVPETFSEFEYAMRAAKAAGENGMMLGAADSYGFYPLFSLLSALGDPDRVRDIVYGLGDANVESAGLLTAAETFKGWVDEELITPDYTGISFGDSFQNFLNGDGLFIVAGTDGLPFAADADTSGFGSFILPRDDGSPIVATGSAQTNFSIAENSGSPDAAALFLDFMSSAAAGQFAIDQGISPLFGTFEPDTDSPFLNDEIVTLSEITATDGYLPYFDWSTPTMLATVQATVSELLAGRITANDLVAEVQANIDEFRNSKS